MPAPPCHNLPHPFVLEVTVEWPSYNQYLLSTSEHVMNMIYFFARETSMHQGSVYHCRRYFYSIDPLQPLLQFWDEQIWLLFNTSESSPPSRLWCNMCMLDMWWEKCLLIKKVSLSSFSSTPPSFLHGSSTCQCVNSCNPNCHTCHYAVDWPLSDGKPYHT